MRRSCDRRPGFVVGVWACSASVRWLPCSAGGWARGCLAHSLPQLPPSGSPYSAWRSCPDFSCGAAPGYKGRKDRDASEPDRCTQVEATWSGVICNPSTYSFTARRANEKDLHRLYPYVVREVHGTRVRVSLLGRRTQNSKRTIEHHAQQAQKEDSMPKNKQQSNDTTSCRSFLRKGLAVAGAGAVGTGLFANGLPAFAEEKSGGLTKG